MWCNLFQETGLKGGAAGWLLGILLLLGGMVPSMAPGGQEVPVILCLGDSLTAGFGLARQESWPSLLQERLRHAGHAHRVVNAGVSGDTTTGALRRLSWVLRTPPAIAIVALGANDGLRGLDPEAMESNLERIITTLRETGARVVLAGMRLPPNLGPDHTAAFARVYPRLAQRHGLPLIPFLLEGVAGRPELNLADGIHPNAPGQERVLENLWPLLESLL